MRDPELENGLCPFVGMCREGAEKQSKGSREWTNGREIFPISLDFPVFLVAKLAVNFTKVKKKPTNTNQSSEISYTLDTEHIFYFFNICSLFDQG